MPYIVTGEPESWKGSFPVDESISYKYPYELDLRPGSDFHNKLRSRIWERASISRNAIQKRFPSWREIDRTLTVYVPLKDEEERVQEKDPNKPVSIVFPYSYSVLESLLTYMSLAFFQEPMFRYEGVEDDDTIGAMLLEQVIKLHCIKNKVPLAAHTMLRDALAYGVGIVVPEWTRRYGRRPVKGSSKTVSFLGTNED